VAVEVRDVALEHYSALAVLVRFPSGEKVWLPLSQIDQIPSSWSIPSSMSVRRGKYLLITDWIAKQKGLKITPRELDIDPERAAESAAPAPTIKPEPLVNGKPFIVAALEQQVERLERDLRTMQSRYDTSRTQVSEGQIAYARSRSALLNAEAQRDKVVADLALAQDALRKANERADKAEAYIAAQGRAQNLPQERFTLLELE
jgi:chromosome condensin MukBEF ATPase and DNA-binding subunit MukB